MPCFSRAMYVRWRYVRGRVSALERQKLNRPLSMWEPTARQRRDATTSWRGSPRTWASMWRMLLAWWGCQDGGEMPERYRGIASRLVIYLASHWREVDPKILERWGEVARAVRKAG